MDSLNHQIDAAVALLTHADSDGGKKSRRTYPLRVICKLLM